MVQDGALAGPGEVPVAVVGQVEHGRLVGCCFVLDAQFIPFGEPVGGVDGQCAGIVLFSIGTHQLQRDADGPILLDDFSGPGTTVESAIATVQMIGIVVGGKLEFLVAYRKGTGGDAVRVAAADGAEVGARHVVILDFLERQRHVLVPFVLVGNPDSQHGGAPIGQVDLHAAAVGQLEQDHGFSVRISSDLFLRGGRSGDGHRRPAPLGIRPASATSFSPFAGRLVRVGCRIGGIGFGGIGQAAADDHRECQEQGEMKQRANGGGHGRVSPVEARVEPKGNGSRPSLRVLILLKRCQPCKGLEPSETGSRQVVGGG